jgi:hypothetical protein
VVRRFAAPAALLVHSALARAQVDALDLDVRVRDATAAARVSLSSRPEARTAVDALLERSWIRERWLLAGATAVVTLEGGGHALPDQSRIVIRASGDRAEVIHAGQEPFGIVPRALDDLLEGGPTWRSAYQAMPDHDEEEAPQTGVKLWSLRFRHQAKTGPWVRAVTTKLAVWYRPATTAEAAIGRLAMDLIALPHLGPEGRPFLRREAAGVGIPLRWRVEVDDESLAGKTAAPVLEGEVARATPARVPESALHAPGAPRFGGIEPDAGGLIGSRSLFLGLRPGGESPGMLRIANRTPFHMYVLAEGSLLARVGPHSEIRVDGLPPGYYRLYARSRYGTAAWGPRDQYVPGAMTLALP